MILHLLSTGHYISPHFFRFSFICCIILQLSVSCASLVFIPRTSTLNTLCNNWCCELWHWKCSSLGFWHTPLPGASSTLFIVFFSTYFICLLPFSSRWDSPRFCLWLSLLLSLYFFLLPLTNLMVPAVFPCGWSQGKLPITEYPPEASHFLHIISLISHPFSASQLRRQSLREVQRLTQDTKTTQQIRARVRVWVQTPCSCHYTPSPNDSASCLVSKSTSLLLWLVSPPHRDFL